MRDDTKVRAKSEEEEEEGCKCEHAKKIFFLTTVEQKKGRGNTR
jgi:hypothetical protein